MSTTHPQLDGTPIASLRPVLSARYALSWQQVVCAVPLACFFLYVSHLPLAIGTWNAVAAGERILQSGHVPRTPPVAIPLAAGAEYFRITWLNDVLAASVYRAAGPAGLSLFATVGMTLVLLLWVRLLSWYQPRRRTLLVLSLLLALLWWRFLDVPGELVSGSLCLGVFSWSLFHPRYGAALRERGPSARQTVWLMLLMAIWANVSAGVLFGVGLLLFLAADRLSQAVSESRQTGQPVWNVVDRLDVRRMVWLFELSTIATLLNPRGMTLWSSLFRAEANPWWRYFGPVAPLRLASVSGVLLALLLLLVVRGIRRQEQIRPLTALSVLAGTIAVAMNENLLVWAGPLLLLVAALAAADGVPVGRPVFEDPDPVAEPQPLQFAWSLIGLLVVWCAFALSPHSDWLLSDRPRPRSQWLSARTPVGVSAFLKQHGASGLVWAPAEWSDWLVVEGSPGLRMFANTEFEILPREVRLDYGRIFQAEHDWLRASDRCAVTTLVVDKLRQPRLVAELRRSTEWTLRHEDRQAMVLTREAL